MVQTERWWFCVWHSIRGGCSCRMTHTLGAISRNLEADRFKGFDGVKNGGTPGDSGAVWQMPPQDCTTIFLDPIFHSGRSIGLSSSRDSRVGVLEVSRWQHRHRVGWDVTDACEGQGATRLAVDDRKLPSGLAFQSRWATHFVRRVRHRVASDHHGHSLWFCG